MSCTEPPAVYRCVIDGAKPGGLHPLQTLCVIAMTKEGGHVSCSVKGGTVFDCNGPIKRVPWAAYNAGAPEPKPPTALPAAKTPDAPPPTVEEMIKRGNEQVKDKAQAVGQGASEATSKTWACIASLFTRCGQ